jgi:hypothetical protein
MLYRVLLRLPKALQSLLWVAVAWLAVDWWRRFERVIRHMNSGAEEIPLAAVSAVEFIALYVVARAADRILSLLSDDLREVASRRGAKSAKAADLVERIVPSQQRESP